MVMVALGRRPADQISSGPRERLAAGWLWFRCQEEKTRKINGLSETSALL